MALREAAGAVDAEIARAHAAGVRIICPDDGADYPVLLRSIPDPPPDPPETTGAGSVSGSETQHTQMALPSGAAGNPSAPKANGRLEVAHHLREPLRGLLG